MLFTIRLLDSDDKSWFEGTRELPADYLLKLALERKPEMLKRGPEFMNGAIPAFAEFLVEKAKDDSNQEAIDKAAIELAVIIATVESCMGIEASLILKSCYDVTVYESGAVRYDRKNVSVH